MFKKQFKRLFFRSMIEDLRLQFLQTIQNTFKCAPAQAKYIFLTIMECVRKKDLVNQRQN